MSSCMRHIQRAKRISIFASNGKNNAYSLPPGFCRIFPAWPSYGTAPIARARICRFVRDGGSHWDIGLHECLCDPGPLSGVFHVVVGLILLCHLQRPTYLFFGRHSKLQVIFAVWRISLDSIARVLPVFRALSEGEIRVDIVSRRRKYTAVHDILNPTL